MIRKLRIEYEKGKCIGAQKCIEVDPQHFKFDGEKADLVGMSEEGNLQILKVEADDTQTHIFEQSAKSCPVNAIKVININEGGKEEVLVSDKVTEDTVKVIKAEYDDLKEFVMDEKGYFLIRVNNEEKNIEVAFCPELNKITVKIVGIKPIDIYQTIIKEELISRSDHAAYLGRELQKAYIALQKGIDYVQDDELNIT